MPYADMELHREDRRRQSAEWVARNPDKVAAKRARYQTSAVAKLMVDRARNRAKASGLDFDLTPDAITIPAVCPILGLELKRNVGGGRMQDGSPSLDRIDPTKGYVKGNVWVISALANRMKNDASPEMLRKFAEWVLR